MQGKLSIADLRAIQDDILGWERTDEGHSIARIFVFKTYNDAISFVFRIAMVAEKMNHHPDIFISYTTVEFLLTTHQVGGISHQDINLAKAINRLARDLPLSE